MATQFSEAFRPIWSQFREEAGLSQNQVANRVRWLRGGKGLDPSVLSCAVSGGTVRRFDSAKLDALCDFMGVSDAIRGTLQRALFQDRTKFKQVAIPDSISLVPFDTGMFDVALANMVESCLHGDYAGARSAGTRIANQLDGVILQPLLTDAVRQAALIRMARTKFEIGRTYYQDAPFDEIPIRLPSVALELTSIIRQLEDSRAKEEVQRLEDITRGYMAYFLEDYRTCANHLSKALKSEADPKTIMWLIRTYGVTLARLGEDSAFRMLESRARGMIREYGEESLETVCFLHEGFGRGHTILALRDSATKAFGLLEAGVASYLRLASDEKVPFRQMQLSRSILETQVQFGTVDHTYDGFIESAVLIARILRNMPRHLDNVEFLLEQRHG